MSEHKIRQRSRQVVLDENPLCIYCGNRADTTDHCPPRCFFVERKWPQGYEFSACKACNSKARLDEQALAVLMKINTKEETEKFEKNKQEIIKLIKGLENNQPEILMEWKKTSRVELKQIFREIYGDAGNYLRYSGWNAINIGPITEGIINRFSTRLASALYYLHARKILDGAVYSAYSNPMLFKERERMDKIIDTIAPNIQNTGGQNQCLSDQFSYRFSYDSNSEALSAIASFFSDQFIFFIIAVPTKISEEIDAKIADNNQIFTKQSVSCKLRNQ